MGLDRGLTPRSPSVAILSALLIAAFLSLGGRGGNRRPGAG